jgi:hypothetical protein
MIGQAIVTPSLCRRGARHHDQAAVKLMLLGSGRAPKVLRGIVEIAGPERALFDEIVARYLRAVGDPREVVRDPEARYFGGRVEEHSLVPLDEAPSAISVSTNGSAAHRQKPNAASEVYPPITPAGAGRLLVLGARVNTRSEYR